MLPQTMGARFLYETFLKNFLKKNESSIDAALKDASKTASNVGTTVTNAAAAATEEVKKDSWMKWNCFKGYDGGTRNVSYYYID